MVEKIKNMRKDLAVNESNKAINGAEELNFIRNRLEKLQTAIYKDVENRIRVVIDDVMQEIRENELEAKEFKNFCQKSIWTNRISSDIAQEGDEADEEDENEREAKEESENEVTQNSLSASFSTNAKKNEQKHKKSRKSSSNHRKIFITRESYLTVLFKVDHIRSIYHIFQIIFILLFMHTISHDLFVEGKISMGLTTIRGGFVNFPYVIAIWLIQHVFVFLLYYAFRTWMYVRVKLNKQSSIRRFWSQSCIALYVASLMMFFYVGTVYCLKLNLPFGSAAVLLLETTRLIMKMHAFVRTNASKVLAAKIKSDADINHNVKESTQLAPFSWYVYFLFAPTLLYRDSYPRTSSIRWSFAAKRFLEAVAVGFLFSYLHERYMRVYFGNFGKQSMTMAELIVKFNGILTPSIIIFLCGFYLILHAWLNFTAELLRFGDRMFYMDWWTCSNYGAFYRKWNIVVHDWLYEYIYRDSYNYLFHSKLLSSIMVFTVSAIVHEHILGFMMQLFFPIMFVLFGIIGVLCVFVTQHAPKSLGNIFLWFSIIMGNGFMMSMYYMEYYAKRNCNIVNENFVDYLIPAVWKCGR